MSDTPETDEFIRCDCSDVESALDFARKLERQRNELAALLKEFAETAPGSVEYSDWPEMQSLVERARALTDFNPPQTQTPP